MSMPVAVAAGRKPEKWGEWSGLTTPEAVATRQKQAEWRIMSDYAKKGLVKSVKNGEKAEISPISVPDL